MRPRIAATVRATRGAARQVGGGTRSESATGSTRRERLAGAFLKPRPARDNTTDPTVDELRDAQRFADDKERVIGLLAAPVAAALALIITSALVANDPPALLGGHVDTKHVAFSVYYELLAAELVLSVAMLGFAWFRKRLFLGIAIALYGLGLFNLHYWGFGVPFLMIGAWLLVRAYRAHHALREAGGVPDDRRRTPRRTSAGPAAASAPAMRFVAHRTPRRRTSAVGR